MMEMRDFKADFARYHPGGRIGKIMRQRHVRTYLKVMVHWMLPIKQVILKYQKRLGVTAVVENKSNRNHY
jgi:hypothetical protein